MLTHGAKHLGGTAVPAIRVGVGGHRLRRTSQHPLIRPSQHARGCAPPHPMVFVDRLASPSPARGEGAGQRAEFFRADTAHHLRVEQAARPYSAATRCTRHCVIKARSDAGLTGLLRTCAPAARASSRTCKERSAVTRIAGKSRP
jgi:hypothetical protein